MLVSLVLLSKLVQTVNGYRHLDTGRLLEITFSIVWDERCFSKHPIHTDIYFTFGRNGAHSTEQFRNSATKQILREQLNGRSINLMP